MTAIRKKLAAAALSSAVLAGLFGGTTLVRDSFAQDAPDQGKVQAPVEVSPEEQRHLEGLSSIFRKVGKSIAPAVVHINVVKTTTAPGMGRGAPYDEMLRRFFRDNDGDGEPDVPEGLPAPRGNRDRGEEREYRQFGTGSGVIMEVNGSDVYVLTNNHVAGGASELVVTLHDGRQVEDGKVIGTDPKSDLAVIKLKADNIAAAPWGDSGKLEKGDWIMAFGSPFGYVGSMTHGIVSALNRQAGILGRNGYENFIQVDAPINPGNSGGPLVNTRGEVVGINTAIASRDGGFNGIGFAIPSNQAKIVYTALKTNGKVTRGYIGVGIMDVSARPKVAETFGYKKLDGVLITDTARSGPASGKLRHGDIVTAVAGKSVKNSQELRNTIALTPPGTDLALTVFRDGKEQEVKLKIAEQPEDLTLAMAEGYTGDPAAKADQNAGNVLGMKLATPDDRLANQYGLGEQRQGAVITELDPKSPAAKAELRPGDVIHQVDNQDILTAKQAADAIRKLADAKKPIRVYVSNSEASRFEVIEPE